MPNMRSSKDTSTEHRYEASLDISKPVHMLTPGQMLRLSAQQCYEGMSVAW